MIALHARRSAASISAWAAWTGHQHNAPGLCVVLTGTDLYHDIAIDASAQRSLDLAAQLVVLQELGPQRLPVSHRAKTRVIVQSAPALVPARKPVRHLRAVMVGHLRDEKLPQTLFAAAAMIDPAEGILIDHIGASLDATLGAQAQRTAARHPHYRYLGAQAHTVARRAMQRAHVLVHCSRLEGGAHVVLEAVQSGTPVLASRMDGNVGMLGARYPGYFEVDDAAGLVALLRQLRSEQPRPGRPHSPSARSLTARLQRHCQERARLFDPQAEQAALHQLVAQLLKA
jgi:putative glycosyltransferase (TIGR04348 family)